MWAESAKKKNLLEGKLKRRKLFEYHLKLFGKTFCYPNNLTDSNQKMSKRMLAHI